MDAGERRRPQTPPAIAYLVPAFTLLCTFMVPLLREGWMDARGEGGSPAGGRRGAQSVAMAKRVPAFMLVWVFIGVLRVAGGVRKICIQCMAKEETSRQSTDCRAKSQNGKSNPLMTRIWFGRRRRTTGGENEAEAPPCGDASVRAGSLPLPRNPTPFGQPPAIV